MKNLEHIVMRDEVWAHITRETVHDGYTMEQQIEFYGDIIAAHVAFGALYNTLSVKDLRQCVNWANTLDGETVLSSNDSGNLEHIDEADIMEAVGRRVMHGSLRHTLDRTKSQRRLHTFCAQHSRNNRSRSMPGMGRLEQKDRQALRDFAGAC